MSPVAAPEQPPAAVGLSRPDQSVLFMSRRSELRLVKKARQPHYGPGGAKLGENPGETLEFRDGVLRLPYEGKVRIAAGQMADASELIAWLEEHPLADDVQEGFWRVDPTAPPLGAEEAQAIQRASRTLDVGVLDAMLEGERAGWARQAVIGLLEDTIGEVKADLAVRDEMVEAEVQARLAEEAGGK